MPLSKNFFKSTIRLIKGDFLLSVVLSSFKWKCESLKATKNVKPWVCEGRTKRLKKESFYLLQMYFIFVMTGLSDYICPPWRVHLSRTGDKKTSFQKTVTLWVSECRASKRIQKVDLLFTNVLILCRKRTVKSNMPTTERPSQSPRQLPT